MVRIIDVNEKNIDEIGMFCKKTKKKFAGYQNKLKWIKERFKEGLKYKILFVKERGKETSRGMIEYIPGEFNWRGFKADGWMAIHCLWIVGKAKNHGYGNMLLECAINDAKEAGMFGVVGMSAEKGGWVPKKKIYLSNGFEKVDEIKPNFALYAKIFDKKAPKPEFYSLSDIEIKKVRDGATIIYTDQCPYIVDLVEELKETSKGTKNKINAIKLNTCKEAQENRVYPYGTYCICINGNIGLYQHSTKRDILEILGPKA